MNLKNITARERNQAPKISNFIDAFLRRPRKDKTIGAKLINGCQGLVGAPATPGLKDIFGGLELPIQ